MTSGIGMANGGSDLETPPKGAQAQAKKKRSATETPGQPARSWIEGLGHASQALLPYWFAASGLALGVGGVVQDKPLAGACGAVAGVTAGLLYQSRARSYQRQAEALRDRLRTQRAESEAESAELRDNLRALRTEIWELKFASQLSSALRAVGLPPGPQAREAAAALATQPLDFGELPAAPAPPAALETPATPQAPAAHEVSATPETPAQDAEPVVGELASAEVQARTDDAATDEAKAGAEPEPEATTPAAEPVPDVMAGPSLDSPSDAPSDRDEEQDEDGAQVIDLRAPAEVVLAAREGGSTPAATTKPASVSAPKKARPRTSAASASSSGDSDGSGSEPAAEPEPARLSSAS
jgi:hypothetical protein